MRFLLRSYRLSRAPPGVQVKDHERIGVLLGVSQCPAGHVNRLVEVIHPPGRGVAELQETRIVRGKSGLFDSALHPLRPDAANHLDRGVEVIGPAVEAEAVGHGAGQVGREGAPVVRVGCFARGETVGVNGGVEVGTSSRQSEAIGEAVADGVEADGVHGGGGGCRDCLSGAVQSALEIGALSRRRVPSPEGDC